MVESHSPFSHNLKVGTMPSKITRKRHRMFSGIIEKEGRVKKASGSSLCISASLTGIKPGDSVAVNGTCLTALKSLKKNLLAFDLSTETLKLTTLGRLKPGQTVNLERALKLSDVIGGHLVSGHVDVTARVLEKINLPKGFANIRVEIPKALIGLIAKKGSVTVDGVSLTVATIGKRYFEAALIPYTLKHTNLGKLKEGDFVNLEADLLARYAAHYLSSVKFGRTSI